MALSEIVMPNPRTSPTSCQTKKGCTWRWSPTGRSS